MPIAYEKTRPHIIRVQTVHMREANQKFKQYKYHTNQFVSCPQAMARKGTSFYHVLPRAITNHRITLSANEKTRPLIIRVQTAHMSEGHMSLSKAG